MVFYYNTIKPLVQHHMLIEKNKSIEKIKTNVYWLKQTTPLHLKAKSKPEHTTWFFYPPGTIAWFTKVKDPRYSYFFCPWHKLALDLLPWRPSFYLHPVLTFLTLVSIWCDTTNQDQVQIASISNSPLHEKHWLFFYSQMSFEISSMAENLLRFQQHLL